MNPQAKKVLKWCAGFLSFLLLLGALFPCTNCPRKAARRVEARNLIQSFDTASRAYKAEYGYYPTGKPSEIVTALTGKNLRSIVFLGLRERDLNQAGEPIDYWKTPFRFERVSDGEPLQLTSAGPDKTFGTQDDVTRNNH